MPVLAENLVDLVADTLQDLGEGTYTDLLQATQDYPLFRYLLQGDKDDIVVEANAEVANGRGLRRDVALTFEDAAEMDELLVGVDTVTARDHMAQVTVPFRFEKAHWIFDVREKMLQGSGKTIVDYIKVRENAARLAAIVQAESQLHLLPASTTTTDCWGLKYWVTLYNDATFTTQATQRGFTGYRPVDGAQDALSAFTDVGGIDPSATANTRWRNYAGRFDGVPDSDYGIARMMRRAAAQTFFRPPFPAEGAINEQKPSPKLILAPFATLDLFEQFAKDKNMLYAGFNVGQEAGATTFMGNPIIWDPTLDSEVSAGVGGTTASAHLVYMLNTKYLKAFLLNSDLFRRTGPFRHRNNHNVFEVWTDLSFNMVCVNRRAQSVLHGAITLA